MRIGLLGYGKMGRTIEQLAIARGHEIAWTIQEENQHLLDTALLQQADVVIEFTRPDAAESNLRRCLEAGVPVVSGTTGWQSQLPVVQELCRETGGSMIWASNFSVGVNLFFALNRYLATLMAQRPEYEPSATEIHHIHKLDAPSGTAVTLLQGILSQLEHKSDWHLLGETDQLREDSIPVKAIREGEVPGTHSILWSSAIDEIEISHRAHSRVGFAGGAVLAAEWLPGKKGCFTMADVLGI